MKLLHTSDLHGHLPIFRDAGVDCVVISGDICPDIRTSQQLSFLQTAFIPWLKDQFKDIPVVCCWGNHDFIGKRKNSPGLDLIVEFANILTNTSKQIGPYAFYGVPQQPVFQNWAFNETHENLLKIFRAVPPTTDILVSHGPPYSLVDKENAGPLGCRAQFDTFVNASYPHLTLCGHIHIGHGWCKYPKLGETTKDKYVVNSALCTRIGGNYQPPHIIVLDDITKKVVSIECGEILEVR